MKLINLCQVTGFRILNGRIGEDKRMIGKCTYYEYHGGSFLDYIPVSDSLMEYVTSFRVAEPSILSDHCVVSFIITVLGLYMFSRHSY